MGLRRRHAVLPRGKVGQFGRSLRYADTALADHDAYGVSFVSLRDNLFTTEFLIVSRNHEETAWGMVCFLCKKASLVRCEG